MTRVTFPKIGEKHNFTPLITGEVIAAGMQRIPKKVVLIYSTKFESALRRSLRLSKHGNHQRHVFDGDGRQSNDCFPLI